MEITALAVTLLLTTATRRSGAATPPAAAATPIPVAERGLKIGAPAPPIAARDQLGKLRDLESLMGPQGLVLLFVRSADW